MDDDTTVRVRKRTLKRLVEIKRLIKKREGRPVSLDEAIKKLLDVNEVLKKLLDEHDAAVIPKAPPKEDKKLVKRTERLREIAKKRAEKSKARK